MVELLAIPEWNAPPRSLDDWVERFNALGYAPEIEPDLPEGAWLSVGSLRLRGYAVLEGRLVTAINFEIHAPDPAPTTRVLEETARSLGWEIHPEDEEEDED